MNFHPDKQLFLVAGTGDRTTDPWITKPVLYLYTMGDPPRQELFEAHLRLEDGIQYIARAQLQIVLIFVRFQKKKSHSIFQHQQRG